MARTVWPPTDPPRQPSLSANNQRQTQTKDGARAFRRIFSGHMTPVLRTVDPSISGCIIFQFAMTCILLLALVALVSSVHAADGTCAKSQWQMGYGTEWAGPIPHVYVVLTPTGGQPASLQGKKCLRAELFFAKFVHRLKSVPSFKIEPSDSCKMTPNAIAKRRKVGRGVSGDLCATQAELEAVMPEARKMNSANTRAAKYVLLKNDCMNFVANFMAMAEGKYAQGAAPRRLKAQSPSSEQGGSDDLLSEFLETVYTDPELKKAAVELKNIETGETSSNESPKAAPKNAKKIL